MGEWSSRVSKLHDTVSSTLHHVSHLQHKVERKPHEMDTRELLRERFKAEVKHSAARVVVLVEVYDDIDEFMVGVDGGGEFLFRHTLKRPETRSAQCF